VSGSQPTALGSAENSLVRCIQAHNHTLLLLLASGRVFVFFFIQRTRVEVVLVLRLFVLFMLFHAFEKSTDHYLFKIALVSPPPPPINITFVKPVL
jgi:hypothetical protein